MSGEGVVEVASGQVGEGSSLADASLLPRECEGDLSKGMAVLLRLAPELLTLIWGGIPVSRPVRSVSGDEAAPPGLTVKYPVAHPPGTLFLWPGLAGAGAGAVAWAALLVLAPDPHPHTEAAA